MNDAFDKFLIGLTTSVVVLLSAIVVILYLCLFLTIFFGMPI